MPVLRLIALALLLVAPVLAGAAEPLVLALSRTPLSLPFFVAESEGYFAAEGVPVRINEILGGHRTMQQMLDGQADLATSSEAVVMFTSFKRDDFVLLASFVTSSDDVKVVVRGDSGMTRPEHLAGKRVGTIRSSASNYYLDTLLLLNGTEPRGVSMRYLEPDALVNALKQRELDAISVWQPFAYQAERQIDGARVLPDGSFYTLSFNLVASRRLLGKRDDDLARVLRALLRAERFIAAEPGKAKRLLQDRLKLDAAYVDWMWPRYRYRVRLDQSLLTTLESEARWARLEGLVPGTTTPNYLRFIHAAPLRRASAGAVGIVE